MLDIVDRTYLGIDYGARRIGLAKSDPSGTIATVVATLEVTSVRDGVAKVKSIIDQLRPIALVIGYPLSLSGERGPQCREVDGFIERLSNVYSGPIHRVDERLSSAAAQRVIHAHGKRIGRDKKRLDRLAAVWILQQFLDGMNRQ